MNIERTDTGEAIIPPSEWASVEQDAITDGRAEELWTETKTKLEAETKPEAETETKSEVETKPEPKTGAEAAARAETETEAAATNIAAGTKTETKGVAETGAEVDRRQIYTLVDRCYMDKLQALFYDGDILGAKDTDDVDSYVTYTLLEDFIPSHEQAAVIEALAKGEPIKDEYVTKIRNGFVELIANMGMYKELHSDPFLRGNYLAKTLNLPSASAIDRSTEGLRNLIWRMDTGFGRSNTMKWLLTNPDYLKQRYQTAAMVERKNGTADPHRNELLEQQLIEHLSGLLLRLAADEKVGGKKILKDPFLREMHFYEEYALEALGKDKYLEVCGSGTYVGERPEMAFPLERAFDLTRLWGLDTIEGLHDSMEYQEAFRRYRREHPEIYSSVDEDAINSEVAEIMEQISNKEILKVIKAYEKGCETGDEAEMALLLPLLGLDKNPPKLKYPPQTKNANTLGDYTRSKHLITVYKTEKTTWETTKKPPLAHVLTKLHHTEIPDKQIFLQRVNTLAHELRHAHQYAGEGIPDEQQAQYRKNLTYYIKGAGNKYIEYREQLVEVDADAFATAFTDRVDEVYDRRIGRHRKGSEDIEESQPEVKTELEVEDIDATKTETELAAERQQAYAIIDANYLDKLGGIFYDGDITEADDTDDVDAYVTSILLEDFISNSEQKIVIETIAKGEPIKSEYVEKIRDGLAKLITNSGILEELQGDPFLRVSHLKRISETQPTPISNWREENLRRTVWRMDVDFKKQKGDVENA